MAIKAGLDRKPTAAERRAANAAAKAEKQRIAGDFERLVSGSEERELDALNGDVQNARMGCLAATKAHAEAIANQNADHAARLSLEAQSTLFSLLGVYHQRAEAIRKARAERKTKLPRETRT